MGHKKTAKALAMLVLENDKLWDDLVDMQEQRDDARSFVRTTMGAEIDDLQASLDAMQRDRDALAAEVRTLRTFINDKVGKLYPAPERPEGAPELDVPHAGPWMAAEEVVGKVVSEHGPCEDGGELVRDVVAHTAGSAAMDAKRLQTIKDTVSDLVGRLLYYDRKEDEDLPRGAIEDAIRDSDISEAEIVDLFAQELGKGLKP